MVAFIDEHRDALRGRADLRACCRSPRRRTTRHEARQATRRAAGARPARCELLPRDPAGVRRELRVYGADKVWRQLRREGIDVGPLHGGAADARAGLRGVARRRVRTTMPRRRGGRARWIWWSGEFTADAARTSCGSPTSPTSRRGAASSTSRSSSTCSPGASSAGGVAARCAPTSPSTRWSRRSTRAGRARRRAGPSQRSRRAVPRRSATPSAWPRPASRPRSAAGRLLRQRARPRR